ncbi:hypothetical protein SARC_12615 [Sphaeroforma arctica JP610]|uniref:Uncharacterized protein n=1 Tax=Sphaeroforma arctica JP610 TaxID=667725 RepID=A0A0L0FFL4_9EUKA|nr:hypothetical protein SARC_12615 [Sphaeroforma arctica JP610]KNC74843.1 hypothetical protein SARC_12615 [Sphaeroforma arctica JP610]|eukprot:XP_014148745.1 hypothetical protein SARC_12615 [Sphaeroforma arctica JP610]
MSDDESVTLRLKTCKQTTSASLQAKLDLLSDLASRDDRLEFVNQFVPLDLSQADKKAYVEDLTSAEEAEGQWGNLKAEIMALKAGQGVVKIEGDQESEAVFYFRHPLLEKCDREVAFVCKGDEWRAEG